MILFLLVVYETDHFISGLAIWIALHNVVLPEPEGAEIVKKLAIDRGFSDEEADILGANAASTYLDIWLDGTYVMEKALAAGKTYEEADLAVEKWAMDPNNNYTDWFERWGEADPEKDWMPDENTFGAYLDSIKGTTIELRDPSEIRKDIEVSMKVYENLNYNTDTLQWEGEVFSEADQVSQAFYDRAIEIGLTEDQARAIQRNNRNAYIDTWIEGTYVYQGKIYEGYSSDEADQYVDSWFNQSRYNDYWTTNENNWNIEIIEDDEGNIKIVVRPLTLEEKIQMGEKQKKLQVLGDVNTDKLDKLKENVTEQVILKDEVGISAEALADAGMVVGKVNAPLQAHFEKVGETMAKEWSQKAGSRGAAVLSAYK